MFRNKNYKKRTTRFLVFMLISLSMMVGFQVVSASGAEIQIISFKGDVEIRQNQSVLWMKAKKGLHLVYGDVVRTGPESVAVIHYESAKIQLYENTILEFPSQTAGQRVSNETNGFVSVFMRKGHSLIKVFKNRLQRRFEVITPSLIAGVKGTMFKVFEEEGLKAVAVAEGIVEVVNQNDLDDVVELTKDHFTMIQDEYLTQAMELHDDHFMLIEKEYLNNPKTLAEINRVNLETQTKDIQPAINEQGRDFIHDLKDEQKTLSAELRAEKKDMKNDLKAESKELMAELRAEKKDLKNDLKAESKQLMAELRDERKNLKDELKEESKELRAELKDNKNPNKK